MSKYITLYAATLLGTYEDFIEMFKEGEQYSKNSVGRPLLYEALCNTEPEERYKIANFLINKGADVKFITKDGASLFFPLFGYGRTDIVKTTILCKTLLEKGADITVLYKPEKTTMFKTIFSYGANEIEMIPLYELIFAQEGLPLLVKDKWGLTVLEFARKGEKHIGVRNW